LPYPSDEFTVLDSSTSTGRRLAVPSNLVVPQLLAQLGPGAQPEDAFSGADGFASLTPIVFEFDRAVDLDSLLANDAAAVAVFDNATGQRMPVRVDVPFETARHGAPGTVVMVWPQIRWEHGHTYVARIDDRLKSGAYGHLRPTLAVLGAKGEYLSGIRESLRKWEGDRWRNVLTVTQFTIRSAANATELIDSLAASARRSPHPIRNISVGPSPFVSNSAAVVTGEVQLTDFRDATGVVRRGAIGRPTWERFLLVLPSRSAQPSGAPVVVYGHGISVSKETMMITASNNATAGLATIGIDIPHHGDRQDEGGYVFDLASPSQLGRLAAMTLQGEVDLVSLMGAITNELRTLDVLNTNGQRVPDGRPDLNVEYVLYEGTSMGGVLGAAAVGLVPEFKGAFLQVAGTGISDTIFNSLIWPLFAGVVPEGGPAGDAMALMGAATMLLDPSDNVNLLDRIRKRGTPVFLVYGVGDAVVPQYISGRMVSLLGLPLVGPAPAPVAGTVPRISADAVPANGFGAAQIYADGLSVDAPVFAGHLVFSDDRASRLLDQWLAGRLKQLSLRR